MDISYKRELNHSYLILKNENQQALSDYPAKMLFSNSIKGLLPCVPRLIDGGTFLYYEITSRQSLSQIYETKKFNSNDLKALFEALLNTITCMEDYLLDADLLLLSPDYIYQDFESSFYFCCFPLEPAPSDKDFVSLTEYLLPKINHEDNNAVLLGYGLYKDSLESPLCPALLKTALTKSNSKEPDVQDLYHSNVFQKQTLHPDNEASPSQDVMTSFFQEETLHEKTSVGWLIGILLSLSAFFVCVYFCLHYRLISISQTILNFLLFILLSGGSLLIFFLTSRHQKRSLSQFLILLQTSLLNLIQISPLISISPLVRVFLLIQFLLIRVLPTQVFLLILKLLCLQHHLFNLPPVLLTQYCFNQIPLPKHHLPL